MARQKQRDKIFRIHGQVINRKDQKGVPGLRVEAWDKDLICDDLLGSATTNANGAFQMEFTEKYFSGIFGEKQPDVFFKIFRGDKMIESTEDSVICNLARQETKISIEVDMDMPVTAEEYHLKVSGKIVNDKGVAAKGLKVIAIDKNPGNDAVLGEAITDDSGNYTILYKKETLQISGKQQADIEIKVVQPTDESKIYGTSAVHYNAPDDEKVNLVLESKILEYPPEFRQITADLTPHIKAGSFKDLQENEERQDISYLANKSGWDARLVAMVSLADKYSHESGIPPEFYYALFRAGMPTNPDGLYRANAETVGKTWEKAVEQNIIDASLKEKIPESLTVFKEYGTTHLLENAKPVGVSTLKDMLDISLPENSRQQEFVDLYFNHTGDMSGFWAKAEETFGEETTANLRLDGKLGNLTLNNAPLITKLRAGNLIQNNPVDLVRNGFYKPETWEELPGDDIQVPENMPGATDEEKKKNYMDFMAFQLKRSYPTAVVAEMVKSNDFPLTGGGEVKNAVYKFFRDTQGEFEIGRNPLEQFLKDNNLELDKAVLKEVKRLQRVYQVSPSDRAMQVLMANNLDSAYSIVQYGEEEFTGKFAETLGGENIAKITYNKAHQVHSTVLNIATSYLTYRMSPKLYALSGSKEEEISDKKPDVYPKAQRLRQSGKPSYQKDSSDDPELVVYATLEGLFDSMDYCTCEHCRSVLSPAAYLVDLLQFIDLKEDVIVEGENPLDVLLKRRPDIEHIQLTCENTNTVLPYIDLVNEIMEYYVVHPDESNPIEGFKGYNIKDDITTEELLANPQFVNDQAYTILKDQVYPFNLPFNYDLEALRLYYDHLKVPLYEAMEKLRVNDDLDIDPLAENPLPYAWRDIYNEYLGISPQEYEVLTNSGAHNLPAYFGEDESITFAAFNEKFSNAKKFSRKTGITYEELIEITKTQFINPNAHLIPKLEKLEVSFADIEANHSDPNFIIQIPTGLDLSKYGGNVVTWLQDNYDTIMHLILLRDFSDEEEGCGFDNVELRYSLPDDGNNHLEEIEFWRLLRFTRLWKTLGWTIAETDKTITALYKEEPVGDSDLEKLDNGFKNLLIKIAHVKRIMEELNLNRKKSLIKLLALWSEIDTRGSDSLYQQMFLHSTMLKIDDVFLEDGYGGYLQDDSEKITAHLPALQAAFNLTGEELSLILDHVEFDENTTLSLENISKIYRYGFLARALKLSIREFITLKTMSETDPFAELEDVHPGILRFIELVQLIKQSGFKITTLGYYLQHEDVTGKASPSRDDILAFAKTIKDGLVRIEQEHKVEDDPTGENTKEKMALVYENDVVDRFFGFLKETSEYSVFSVEYTHPQDELEQSLKINDRISYDHSENRLNYQGIMPIEDKEAFEDAANTLGNLEDFKQAIDELYNAGQDFYTQFTELETFLVKFPDLKGPYEAFLAFTGPGSDRFAEVLKGFLPDLVKKLKHLFIKQTLGASTNIDQAVLGELLENKDVIHSVESTGEPAVEDFLKLEENGAPGSQFYLEVPGNGFYTFYIEMSANLDPNADEGITLLIDGNELNLDVTGQMWKNGEPAELTAGKLYLFEVEITGSANIISLKWESTGIGKNSIPVKYVCPYEIVRNFSSTYMRVLKAAALVEGLALTENETRFFGTHTDFQVDGEGFLNALPADTNTGGDVNTLFGKLTELFRYARLKESLKIKGHQLVTLFENPAANDENGEPLLSNVTGWHESSKNELLKRFDWAADDLSDLDDFQWDLYKFLRVYEAFKVVNKFGVNVVHLLDWTGNRPEPEKIRDIQCSFKAKYDEEGWLEVLQPINDTLRDRRRDALVSHVLHQMQRDPTLQAVDTPDKLFEYFLIDVEMGTCMKTSRIKQAISAVQLFVQRCLMNMEPNVSPKSIKKEQWEWMKRYRVWEANRKVFLYPENWLEPELRDNKSPFFRDLESELLQADITAEMAERAYLNYLEKLDDVAKLEISGMYLQEDEKGNEDDYILHVFGRTAGASRKYYYRRYQYGYWTPWEKVDQAIEDNPILPVIWNGRIFLFWLNIVRKAPDGKPQDDDLGSENLMNITLEQLNQQVKEIIEINLCWSEYYNKKWQPKKTSDFEKPVELGEFKPGEFKREQIKIFSVFPQQEQKELIVYIIYPDAPFQYFKLFNKHSVPVRDSEDTDVVWWLGSVDRRFFNEAQDKDKLHVEFWIRPKPPKTGPTEIFDHEVLSGAYLCESVQHHHDVENVFEAPFFFQDAKHVFFVKPEENLKMVRTSVVFWDYISKGTGSDFVTIVTKPEIETVGSMKELPKIRITGIGPDPVSTDFYADTNFINKIISTPNIVSFGNANIGAMGSPFAKHLYNSQLGIGNYESAGISQTFYSKGGLK